MKFLPFFILLISSLFSQDINEITKILTGKSEKIVKCLRPYELYYKANLNKFDRSAQNAIEKINFTRSKKTTHKFISVRGFEINYSKSGNDAVPLASNDGDTIPDYVQSVASYFDYSFDLQVTTLGFDNPKLNSNYRVDIVNLGNSYGTTAEDGNGSTYIRMDNDYIGFGANNDPNKELGSAKVTAAHEFKHAIQYVQDKELWLDFSNSWVETDATWTEELVYDHVDDYYNYLNASQLVNPSRSLHNLTGTGSYQDVIFQIVFSEIYGNQAMVDFWNDRKQNPFRTYYETFNFVLSGRGGLNEFATNYFVWNHYTNQRSINGFGYPEANFYRSYNISNSISSEGVINGQSLAMSSNPYEVNVSQDVYMSFSVNSSDLKIIVAGYKDNNAVIDRSVFTKGANQVVSQFKSSEYDSIYLLVYNTLTGNQSIDYELTTSFSSDPIIIDGDQKVNLSKNPVMNNLNFVSKSSSVIKYEIYNVLGQRVKIGNTGVSTNHSISLKGIAAGIYFLRVSDKNYQDVLKFVRVR